MAPQAIWVVVDRQGSAANDQAPAAAASLELLSAARSLSGNVVGVTWGEAGVLADSLAGEAGRFGATVLATVGDLAGGLPGPAMAAAMAARILAGDGPDVVLAPHNYDGRDIAARLSARIDRPVLTNVVGLVGGDAEGGGSGLVAEHAIFGGTEVLRARFTGPGPHIFVVRPKSFPASEVDAGPAGVVSWEVGELGRSGDARIVEVHVDAGDGPRLDEAAVVVAGGRGLGDAATYELVRQLAALLRGAPGASRAIVDAGWVPYSHQVGQTGKTVKPTVYIAAGISGATQHMVGMKDARHIVAINKDREAPIFSIADLGVVGDVHKVLPRLIEALRSRGPSR